MGLRFLVRFRKFISNMPSPPSAFVVASISSIFITVMLICVYQYSQTSEGESVMTLRVGFPNNKPIEKYDPANIQLAPDYVLVENLFSPLVEFDPTGKLAGGVAENFEWHGTDLFFKIRRNLRTLGGRLITAEDAAFSIKRLLILDTSTHGNLRAMFCKHIVLTSPTQPCEEIQVTANGDLILKVGRHEPFLIPLLASIDFAVVPISSVDPKTLAIVNYKETSGPYSFAGYLDGGMKLKVNRNHYHFSPNIPKEVQLIFTRSGKESSQFLDSGKVDALTTVDHLSASAMMSYAKTNRDFNLHVTMNSRSLVSTFTQRGIKEYDEKKRWEIANAIRKAMKEFLSTQEGFEIQDQIFPIFGDAGLDQRGLERVRQIVNTSTASPVSDSIRVRIVRLEPADEYLRAIKSALPNAVIEFGTVPKFDKRESAHDAPHIFVSGPDLGYFEDFSLISYYMGAGYFGLYGTAASSWLESYQRTQDKQARIKLLKDLHLETIVRARTIPIAVYPYTALARKHWAIGLSNFFADTQLWLFQYQ